MKIKRIKLILPLTVRYSAAKNEVRWRYPPYALSLVAAYTPKDIEVEIVDENVDVLNLDDRPDLVGISCVTATSPQAYKIADHYRGRGIPVVLGGKHPTALPDEAIQHADAVVIGEAEYTWPELIDDFRSGNNKGIYKSDIFHDLKNLPLPRRDLLVKQKKKYDNFNTIQTTRGCPYDCEFCSTGIVSGRKIRTRPVGEVITEIKTLQFDRIRPLIFWDDTINCVPDYASELFQGLIPLGIKWGGYASVNMAKNEKLVALARKSGCVGLFVGFESVSEESMKSLRKTTSIDYDYHQVIDVFHKNGISLLGSFIFGLDGDGPMIFEKTYEFIKKSKLDSMYFNIVQPYPGTRMFDRLTDENRILTNNWGEFFLDNPCFTPKNMSVEQLKEGYRWIYKQASQLTQTVKRMARVVTQRPESSLIMLAQNLGLRRTCRLIHS